MRMHEIDSYVGMVIAGNSTVSGMLVEGGLDIPDTYRVMVTHDRVASLHHVQFNNAAKDGTWYRQALPSERLKYAMRQAWLDSGVQNPAVEDMLL